MAKKSQNISDRELRRLLASFKEEVAAPPQFRSRLMERIAADRGLSQALPKPSLAGRVNAWLRLPILVPTALGLALALGIWNALQSPDSTNQIQRQAELSASGRNTVAAGQRPAANSPASASSEFAASRPVAPESPRPSKAGAETAEVQRPETPALVAANPSSSAPAPLAPRIEVPAFSSNGGSASTGAPASSASIASQDKPIVIEITPTKTPLAKALRSNSEVRRNKFLASRGEYCAILFKMDFPGQARVEIYDRLGRIVDVPLDSVMPAGIHEVRWHGHNKKGELSATGVYLVRIKAGRMDERHKVVMVK